MCTAYPYGVTTETIPDLLCSFCHVHMPQDGNARICMTELSSQDLAGLHAMQVSVGSARQG